MTDSKNAARPDRRSPMPKTQKSRRGASKNVTAVLGPTNTGKTHLAIERMLASETGLIGLPLRLLAREVYDRVAARTGADQVALITGEEKIKPPEPRYYVCTVEAMPREVEVDLVAIDEVQLAADPERGHVFTDRMLHFRGTTETLLLGAATMRSCIANLFPDANQIARPRLSKLSYAGEKKISRLPRRSAIVAFSANDVYAIAELIRRQRGGAAVVLGALSPRTRNAQVALYQSGDVDFLVATDAIGMGLNLDVDHVAFAGIRKFDGHRHRDLTAGEIGQIAGRAGRHMNDGTFGVTGTVPPFTPDLIERLEEHQFESVRVLQWRNTELDFSSLDSLLESLRVPPKGAHLARARAADDLIALETLSSDPDVKERAASEDGVRLLWETCQIPDYRKISHASHSDLVGTIFSHLTSSPHRIDEDWYAEQLALADRTDGDLDTLSNRLAHVRTWTFVANRPGWLSEPDAWQERARDIEDRLSDALHERLTHRFVDRRTSTLMKRLRDDEELVAEVREDGSIHMENHFVGRLDGFQFTLDPQAEGIHGKAARAAAMRVVTTELASRAQRLLGCQPDEISLSRTGELSWSGSTIGQLVGGPDPLKPGLQLHADDHLPAPARDAITAHLAAWLSAHIAERLKPLADLADAEDVTGLARGLAFRLTENLGVLAREEVGEDVRALDQDARAQLRKYGVRFGAFNIYVPALLKPAAADLVLALWSIGERDRNHLDITALPERPQQGLTSVAYQAGAPEAFYRVAGFHICGARAVRIDMLERLADMIRPIMRWQPREDEARPPAGVVPGGGFMITPDMMSLVGCSGTDFEEILTALSFRKDRRLVQGPPQRPVQQEAAQADGSASAAQDQASGAELPHIEIWRPRRGRKNGRSDHRADHARADAPSTRRGARPQDGGKSKSEDGKSRRPASGKRQRPSLASGARGGTRRSNTPKTFQSGASRTKPEDSPFAVLTKLKERLEKATDES